MRKNGLNYTRAAKFHYAMAGNDKGKAVRILCEIFRKKHGNIMTVALGDNENDKPMLKIVDKPFMLKHGPGEWNRIVLGLLKCQK